MKWPTDRCAWCNRPGDALREITVRVWKPIAAKEETQTLVVHPEHEEAVRDYVARQRRSSGPVLYTILGMMLLLVILGNASLTVSERLSAGALSVVVAGVGGGTIALGTLLFAFPLPTDSTVRALGIRRAVRAVRIASLFAVALGGWVVWLGVGG